MAPFEIAHGRGVIRFLHFFNYPKDIAVEDGEKWYFHTHVPSAKKLPGIVRYRTWKGLPSIKMWTYDPFDRFVRMSELVFENMDMCLKSTVHNPVLWSPATGQPGFNEFECMMLNEAPQYNLLQDVPVQQFKYMSNPAVFTGAPEYDESEDTFIDVYMLNYRVPVADGEDWYLGHHTREGRIGKQLGNKHYQTWKTLTIPETERGVIHPNRFYRLTELGLPDWTRGARRPGGLPKSYLTYTRSPLGEVLNEWRNILIDPKDVQVIV
ncbi:MAG: hypothetical protein PHE50_03785 [Dehalococcoidales bacterium]|nr:hypothetical protein [Dehalococcoidales bacterium]